MSDDQEHPVVSIITVCWNPGPILKDCIQSVNSQSYGFIEHIIIDGGSTDGTALLVQHCSSLPGSKLKHFSSEPDEGIYDAMNKGLAVATGKWVYFLNSDDRLFDHRSVEAAVRALQETGAEILQSRVLLSDPTSGTGSMFAPARGLRRTSPLFHGIYQQAIWAEKALFDKYGGFDTTYRLCGDVDWLMRVLRASPRCSATSALTTVFQQGGASSNFACVKQEHRQAEMRHYSKPEWVRAKLARRAGRLLERLARVIQN